MSKKTIILCLIGCFMMCGVLVLSAVHFGQARKPHHTKVAKSYTVSQEKKKVRQKSRNQQLLVFQQKVWKKSRKSWKLICR